MEVIKEYFPDLTSTQLQQIGMLQELYTHWNDQINVISRKDIDKLYEHHVLHSLAVAKFVRFKDGSKVLDLGTGGGLPGIPLAILFPNVSFTLIDARAKKIKVVNDIAQKVGMTNVNALHGRAEELKDRFDFVTARAVAPLEKLTEWTRKLFRNTQINALPNGLIAFKGGNVAEEIKTIPGKPYTETIAIQDFYDDPYFTEKYLVYVQH